MSRNSSEVAAERFRGVYALLLTPYSPNKEIDWVAYDRYVDWQLSKRPDGLFAVCGSSEMECLSLQERLDLARRAAARAEGVPVLATGNVQDDPAGHEEELARMADTGVSGIVLIPPGNMGEDQSRLEHYFARMAELSPLPVFLYECPLASPRHVAPDVYGRLARQHGIVGIKDTTCTPEGIRAKIESATDSLVFQANMSYLRESVQDGAQGIMATTGSAAVDAILAYWRAETSGDIAIAEAAHELLVFLDGVLGKGYPATAKHLVNLRGVPMETITRKAKGMNGSAAQGIAVWWRAAERMLGLT
jgi:4-hydroxy-tetrahydrodipicolinate synthase